MIWRNVVSNSCTFFLIITYCEVLLFVNQPKQPLFTLHPCMFGMCWLDLLSKAQRPTSRYILWYGIHIILLFVCFPLCKLQQTKHISLLPFCVWKEKGKCFLCGKSSYLGHPPTKLPPCKKEIEKCLRSLEIFIHSI